MKVLFLILFFIFIWFFYLSVLTYYRFKADGIGFSNILIYLAFPIMLFMFHMHFAFKTNSYNSKLKIIGFFIFKYKYSLIFFSEVLLENAARRKATGYSPVLDEKEKTSDKNSLIKQVVEWFKKPASNDVYGRLVLAS